MARCRDPWGFRAVWLGWVGTARSARANAPLWPGAPPPPPGPPAAELVERRPRPAPVETETYPKHSLTRDGAPAHAVGLARQRCHRDPGGRMRLPRRAAGAVALGVAAALSLVACSNNNSG